MRSLHYPTASLESRFGELVMGLFASLPDVRFIVPFDDCIRCRRAKRTNTTKARVRAKVDYPFRILKRAFRIYKGALSGYLEKPPVPVRGRRAGEPVPTPQVCCSFIIEASRVQTVYASRRVGD
jgi:hypothetical protein